MKIPYVQGSQTRHSTKMIWLALVSFLISGIYLSLRFGALSYSHQEVIAVLRHPLTDTPLQDIIWDIRLPRLLAALLIGASMATSGAILQGITRNPIADPSLLGINSGAALALILAMISFPSVHYILRLFICLIGAGATAAIIFGFSHSKNSQHQPMRFILAGVMVSTFFNALGQALTIRYNLSTAIIGWQAGSLSNINWKTLSFLAPILVTSLIICQLFAHHLTILTLDNTLAKSLGLATRTTTLLFLSMVLFQTATTVAVSGTLSFIGLAVPHIVKRVTPQHYRQIFPLTMGLGATFLLWADLASRLIHPPYETPLNAIISLIGFPTFIWFWSKK